MKKMILIISVLICLGFVSESRAETTCTWEGTKLIIGGSGEFSGCDPVYDDNDNEIDWYEQQEKITEIEFGDNITALGEYAFENVPNLTSLNTNNIATIGVECFDSLQNLTTLELPNVIELGECAFENAESLTSVNMPKLERIGGGPFGNAINLRTLEIPDSLVFADCDALRTNSDVVLIISDKIDMTGWDSDVLNDYGNKVTFKCKGDQIICKTKVAELVQRAYNIYGYDVIFDAGDHRECFRTREDEENVSYYHTGTECAELPESGNITCASGYADYNGNCYAQLPFSKKRWTPAEANQWLHDGNDNFVVLTFKK